MPEIRQKEIKTIMDFKNSERELAIVANAGDKIATIHITAWEKYFKKLLSLAEEFPDTYKLISEDIDKETGDVYYRCYEAPKTCAIGLRKPKTISEEFKQAASDRFKKMWSDKKNQESEDSDDSEDDE